jgi:predicted acyltransferase
LSTTHALPAAANSGAAGASSQRLLALDAFRGITILGMILVNNPGSWGRGMRYAPLDHAHWFGWTPTDLVFPFFVFIVGTALAYSLRKYREGAVISPAVYGRIARRTLALILLGIGLDLFGHVCAMWWGDAKSLHLDTLRFPGVLQRIGVVYCVTSLIVLHLGVRGQAAIGAVLLLGYAAMLTWLPNPHDKAANLTPEGNIVRLVDGKLISPAHWYTQGRSEKTDPEGLLSNLPAIVTALLGYWSGLAVQRRGANLPTVGLLVVCGVACAAIGLTWDSWLPIGKKLWTSSFVMLTGGLAMIALAACLAVFDVAGWRRLARPFEVVGVNAITVYVGAGIMETLWDAIPVKTADGETALKDWIFENVFSSHIAEGKLASLAMALATVAVWWAIAWALTRVGWKVRV